MALKNQQTTRCVCDIECERESDWQNAEKIKKLINEQQAVQKLINYIFRAEPLARQRESEKME